MKQDANVGRMGEQFSLLRKMNLLISYMSPVGDLQIPPPACRGGILLFCFVWFVFFKCINSATTWKSLKGCKDFLQSERVKGFIVICTSFHPSLALRHHKED